jgi:hypothetical protein
MGTTRPVKLLMTWNIVPGREQEYFEFMVREFVPGIKRLGIEPTEAWLTTYGKRPQILTGGITDTLSGMRTALGVPEWTDLRDRLMEYVTNFEWRVVHSSGGFQM